MTKPTKSRCVWCGERFLIGNGPGRRPKYCRRAHRQRAYEARRLAGERRLADDEVLLAASTWFDLRDAVYVAETVAADALVDLEHASDRGAIEAVVRDLRQAIATVVDAVGEPKAVGGDL